MSHYLQKTNPPCKDLHSSSNAKFLLVKPPSNAESAINNWNTITGFGLYFDNPWYKTESSPLQPSPSPPWNLSPWWKASPTGRPRCVAQWPALLPASPGTPTWTASRPIAHRTTGRSPRTTRCTRSGPWTAWSWTVWCGIPHRRAPAGSKITWWCTVSIHEPPSMKNWNSSK